MNTTQSTRTRKNPAARIVDVLRNQWQEQQYLQEQRLILMNHPWGGPRR